MSDSLRRTELLLSNLLRWGVLLCLLVIGVGLALRLAAPGSAELVGSLVGGNAVPDFHPPATAGAFLAALGSLNPDGIIAFGLVLLIGLPIVRVAVTTVLFLHERDWAFVLITLVVLAVLLSGIFLEKALY